MISSLIIPQTSLRWKIFYLANPSKIIIKIMRTILNNQRVLPRLQFRGTDSRAIFDLPNGGITGAMVRMSLTQPIHTCLRLLIRPCIPVDRTCLEYFFLDLIPMRVAFITTYYITSCTIIHSLSSVFHIIRGIAKILHI